MENKLQILAFWQGFISSIPDGRPLPAGFTEAYHFCDNENDANELAVLVQAGIKTATCGMLWAYEAEGEAMPQVGEYNIITDWDEKPVCVIELTEVQIRSYNAVNDAFAYDEGEGDRSLAYWRRVHWEAFSRECALIRREPAESMPLVCERFRMVYP